MKTPSILALACILAAPVSVLAANDSVYTDLKLDTCKTIDEAEVSVTMKCGGLKDYPVYFTEGDLRQSVLYGPVSQSYIEGTFESFSPFNHIGEKVEWRVDDEGKPTAAILRWFIENSNPDTGETDQKLQGQVLVVSHVAQADDDTSCVTGYVDALENKDANTLARQLADTIAADFECGTDKAEFHGKRGEKTSEPTSSFPQN
ncbi:hypothetical protein [Pararhizobium sp.]|uniref:hypothetical protein n=1 Tax=Pararhizobium sp. TaxID=1977563 RepID=UPI00271E4D84|nr:hypothetical protein [Pararhizobium sp.]MDO9416545.1 hypothetical protein [Pararhizobium sp.]